MSTLTNRAVGLWCLFGVLLQVSIGTLVSVDTSLSRRSGEFFRESWPVFVIIGLLMLIAIVALRSAGATGTGRLATVGLVLAVSVRLLFIAGEIVDRLSESGGKVVLGVSEPVTALGMIVLGIAVLRHGLWQGPLRYAPLLVGLYVFLVLLPSFAASGGPNFAAVAGWGVCWGLLGIAFVKEPNDALSTVPVS